MWEKLKYVNIKKIYYKKRLEFLEDIKTDKKIRKITNNFVIPVDIKFIYAIKSKHYIYDNNDNLFRLNESLFKEKNKNIEEKK